MVFLLARAFVYFAARPGETLRRAGRAVLSLRGQFKKKRLLGFLKGLFGFSVFFLFFRILRLEMRQWTQVFPDQNFLLVLLLFGFKRLLRLFDKHAVFVIVMFGVGVAYIFGRALLGGAPPAGLGSVLARGFLVMAVFWAIRTLTRVYAESGIKETMPFAPWMFLGVLLVWSWGMGWF
jgi:hypothetical protein